MSKCHLEVKTEKKLANGLKMCDSEKKLDPRGWSGSYKQLLFLKKQIYLHMSSLVGKPTMWFPNRSDTNRPVQAQKKSKKLERISDYFHLQMPMV